MEVLCPSCGYHLVSLDTSTPADYRVKTEQTGHPSPARSTTPNSSSTLTDTQPVKPSEPDSAQQSGSDVLTTVEKVRVQELYKEGYALARIRGMIGKSKVSLAQIQAATKLDKGRR